jgi:hypothetical protein
MDGRRIRRKEILFQGAVCIQCTSDSDDGGSEGWALRRKEIKRRQHSYVQPYSNSPLEFILFLASSPS